MQATSSKILITGATGFVGRMLVKTFLEQTDHERLRLASRFVNRSKEYPTFTCMKDKRIDYVSISNLSATTAWETALEGCETVVHLAARVHVMKEVATDPLSLYREINRDGTRRLAEQAAQQGVKRLIYLSSIKVNGEETKAGHTFGPNDVPYPKNDYAVSKWEAEQALLNISQQTGMQVLIIRPPLVYGPGVIGNFAKLMQAIKKGYPLPLKSIRNQRSLISVYNLVDFILHCLKTPFKQSEVFCISDGEDLSTAALFYRLAEAMQKPAHLFPVPPWLLYAIVTLLGRKDFIQRLCGSLQVDGSKASKLLNWQPPLTVKEGLARMIQDQTCLHQDSKDRKSCSDSKQGSA